MIWKRNGLPVWLAGLGIVAGMPFLASILEIKHRAYAVDMASLSLSSLAIAAAVLIAIRRGEASETGSGRK